VTVGQISEGQTGDWSGCEKLTESDSCVYGKHGNISSEMSSFNPENMNYLICASQKMTYAIK
jgi:hypothetical protein